MDNDTATLVFENTTINPFDEGRVIKEIISYVDQTFMGYDETFSYNESNPIIDKIVHLTENISDIIVNLTAVNDTIFGNLTTGNATLDETEKHVRELSPWIIFVMGLFTLAMAVSGYIFCGKYNVEKRKVYRLSQNKDIYRGRNVAMSAIEEVEEGAEEIPDEVSTHSSNPPKPSPAPKVRSYLRLDNTDSLSLSDWEFHREDDDDDDEDGESENEEVKTEDRGTQTPSEQDLDFTLNVRMEDLKELKKECKDVKYIDE